MSIYARALILGWDRRTVRVLDIDTKNFYRIPFPYNGVRWGDRQRLNHISKAHKPEVYGLMILENATTVKSLRLYRESDKGSLRKSN